MSELPRLMKLHEGAERVGLTAADLRAGIRNGLLTHVKIGRKFFVTEPDLASFIEQCRVSQKDQGSGCDPAPAANRNGSFSTEDANLPQAAALAIAKGLSKRLPPTSERNTSRKRVAAGSPRSTSLT